VIRDARELKADAAAAVRDDAAGLCALSRGIHSVPEAAYAEHEAVAAVRTFLSQRGIAMDNPAYGLDTAFQVEMGDGEKTVVICAEYDALPQIGHACGHNIIAAAAVGAFIGLSAVSQWLGLRVRLLGTPAEEAGNGAGKVVMLERGAFEGVTAAMMIHPAPFDVLRPVMISAAQFEAEYIGRESHAAFYPELGVNAADALSIAQVALAFLRQSLLPTDRLHGIVVDGGDAPNIIPARSAGRFMVRTERSDQLDLLLRKVFACFEAGALATGAELRIKGADKPYAHVEHNRPLAEMFRENAERLGRDFKQRENDTRPSGSTDMGNVSLKVPSIHPFLGIGSWPAVNHQPEFTAHCATEAADQAVLDGAIAMAWTVIDLAAAPDVDHLLRDE
jgi:amidohydrolase